MKKEMIVAMSCTANWYHYLLVDLHSLLSCTKTVKKIYLLIETEDIDDVPYLKELKEKFDVEIELIDINPYIEKYLTPGCPNRNTIYSNFCFGRLLLPKLVKEDKILYIDTDAIVRRDISNVWKYDIEDYYLAGVPDIGVIGVGIIQDLNIEGRYCNSGFVVFNLKKLRKDKIVEKWFDIINMRKLRFPDQDAMNLVCTNKEFYLSSMYNFANTSTPFVCSNELVKVFHYTGDKSNWVVDKLYGEEWYDSEEKFYNDFGWKRKKGKKDD